MFNAHTFGNVILQMMNTDMKKLCKNCGKCRYIEGENMGICKRTYSSVYIHSIACRYWEEIVTIF